IISGQLRHSWKVCPGVHVWLCGAGFEAGADCAKRGPPAASASANPTTRTLSRTVIVDLRCSVATLARFDREPAGRVSIVRIDVITSTSGSRTDLTKNAAGVCEVETCDP